MSKFEAIGLVEVTYFTNAIEILDAMIKTCNVQYLNSEKYLGGKLVTIIVGGSMSSVTSAIEAAKKLGENKELNPVKAGIVIGKPHDEIMKFIIPLVKDSNLTEEVINYQENSLDENEE